MPDLGPRQDPVLGARSASRCRTVTVAPHQNLFETGIPPRNSTVCVAAPPPGGPQQIAPSVKTKPLNSDGRGAAQPPGRSSPQVGARWPHPLCSLGGRKDVATGQALADLGASARFAKTAGRSGNLERVLLPLNVSTSSASLPLCPSAASLHSTEFVTVEPHESADKDSSQHCAHRTCSAR